MARIFVFSISAKMWEGKLMDSYQSYLVIENVCDAWKWYIEIGDLSIIFVPVCIFFLTDLRDNHKTTPSSTN